MKPAQSQIELLIRLINEFGIIEPWVIKAVRSLQLQPNPRFEARVTAYLSRYLQTIEMGEANGFVLPASQHKLDGELDIGHIIGRSHLRSRLSLNTLAKHILIAGSSGYGKTVLALDIAEQALHAGIRGLRITDPKANEFVALAQKYPNILVLHINHLRFNLFDPPPNVPMEQWWTLMVNHFALCYNFWQGGESLLMDGIFGLYEAKKDVTITNLKNFIERKKGFSSKDYVLKSTILSRLRMKQYQFGKRIETRSDMLEALSELPCILIVEGLLSESESWFNEYLLLWDFYNRKFNPDKRFLTLRIYDECQHRLFSNQKEKSSQFGGAPLISKLVDEARALNLGIVAVSQEPSTLIKAILNNAHTKFCLHLGSGQEIQLTSQAMGLNREQTEKLHYLETGEAIVRSGTGYLDAYPVSIDLFDATKALSDEDFVKYQSVMLQRFFDMTLGRLNDTVFDFSDPDKPEETGDHPNKPADRSKEPDAESKTEEKEASTKVSDIDSVLAIWLNLKSPFLTQGQIMQKAEIKSGSKQTQIKNKVIRESLVIDHKIQVGRTYASIWEPTELCYSRIGLKKPSFRSKGGYLHQFIAHHVCVWAKKNGSVAQIEYLLSNNKAVDVMARDKGSVTFFEIVVSQPYEKELTNIEKDLSTSLQPDRLVFLVTDSKVRKSFVAMLETAEIKSEFREIIEVELAGKYLVS